MEKPQFRLLIASLNKIIAHFRALTPPGHFHIPGTHGQTIEIPVGHVVQARHLARIRARRRLESPFDDATLFDELVDDIAGDPAE